MAVRESDRAWRGIVSGVDWLTAQVIKRDIWIILAAIGLSVFAGVLAPRLQYYDDITSFFPEGSEEVDLFLDVGKEFGGLDIALVGVQTDDIFTLERLRIVRKLSKRLQQVKGVDSVTSLTEMRDFEERQMGVETGSYIQDLIGELPDGMDEEEIGAIRDRVMSREHIVGSLVSRDGDSALVVCRVTPGANIKEVADAIKDAAQKSVAGAKGVKVFFGGAPLISSYIATGASSDHTRLTPWVILAVVIIVLITLRSLPASIVSLVTVGFGLVWTLGLMVLFGRSITLVTSSLPMILVALGSAYPIHILARYFKILGERGKGADRREVIREVMRQVSMPVIMSAVTTMVGFSSFLVFNIQPLREFGLIMAVGVFFSLVISLIFIPAVLSRIDIGRLGSGRQSERLPEAIRKVAQAAADRPVVVLVLFSIIMASCLFGTTRITTETDMRSYFAPDSEPIRADDFMVGKFGGSLFLQLYVEGDLRSPEVLKELEKLEDFASSIPEVSDIQSVSTVVTLANAAMMGKRQIPETHEQVESLAFLAEDDPQIRLLVADGWEDALVQIRIGGFDTARAHEIASEIEDASRSVISTQLVTVALDDVADSAARRSLGKAALDDAAQRLALFLSRRGLRHQPAEAIAGVIEEEWQASAFLGSAPFRKDVEGALRLSILEDELVYLRDAETDWDALVGDVMGAFADRAVTEQEIYDTFWAYADDEEHDLEKEALARIQAGEKQGPTGLRKAVRSIRESLVDIERRYLARAVLARVVQGGTPDWESHAGKVLVDKADQHLSFLFTRSVTLPERELVQGAAGVRQVAFDVRVTGYPLLYQQMNVSVWQNQVKSSAVALFILFCLLGGLFWSVRVAIISMIPAVTTLVVTFGILGFFGSSLDIGVSMISIIALGMAVDYAIHFLWKYGEVASGGASFPEALRETMSSTGVAIFANAFEVMCGFAIMLFASLVPVRKSGGLISETLFLAGIATLFLMPVFLKFAHAKAYGEKDAGAEKRAEEGKP